VVPDFDQPPHASLNEVVRWQAGRARQLARGGWKRAGVNGSNGKIVEPDGPVASPRLLLGNGHEPPSAEAYRTLRTSLLLSREGGAPRVIVIASAAGTEGKTTTAVNTAAALASSGAPVLLIDGDLRLPRCHDALGLPLEPGLSEYLSGDVTAEPIQPTGVPNLSFLAAGHLGANPTQLLTSWRLGMLLWQARKTFDFIVIDSPPLLAVSDALLLANLADGVVLVTERGKTTLDGVKGAVQRLQQAGVTTLGVVLNRGEIEFEYYRYTRATVRTHTVPAAPVEGEEQYS
jgi:receptor protein-tyrosine kinase